jgi:hypothetical protein
VCYGKDGQDPHNVAVECESCGEVLFDFNHPDVEVVNVDEESSAKDSATKESTAEVRMVVADVMAELMDAQRRYDNGIETTNENRRTWAKMSIRLFAALTGGSGDSWEDNVSDLIADVLHFCKKEQIDFYDLLERAQEHFADEEAEESLNAYAKKED